MAKIKTDITKMLNQKLNEEIGKKKTTNENSLTKEDLKDIIEFEIIDELTEDSELQDFLKDQTLNIFNCISKNSIVLGEIFETVADEIGKKGSQNGLYEKWLDFNGFNKTTAWRYRQRYQLYSKVEDKAKPFVMGLPYRTISEIYKTDDVDGYVSILNEGIKLKDLNSLLNTEKIEYKPEKILENIKFDIEEYTPILNNIKESSKSLDDKKKIELQKYLDKIVEILK